MRMCLMLPKWFTALTVCHPVLADSLDSCIAVLEARPVMCDVRTPRSHATIGKIAAAGIRSCKAWKRSDRCVC